MLANVFSFRTLARMPRNLSLPTRNANAAAMAPNVELRPRWDSCFGREESWPDDGGAVASPGRVASRLALRRLW
jgi:hypothetical protein